jgi:N12 class adenine-specific DNA methylase
MYRTVDDESREVRGADGSCAKGKLIHLKGSDYCVCNTLACKSTLHLAQTRYSLPYDSHSKEQSFRRMPSFWMIHLVAFVRTEVSKERIASIIRVRRIGKLAKTLVITSNRNTQLQLLVTANVFPTSPILVTLMIQVTRSCETSVCAIAARRYISKDGILSHHREKLKSHEYTETISFISLTGYGNSFFL